MHNSTAQRMVPEKVCDVQKRRLQYEGDYGPKARFPLTLKVICNDDIQVSSSGGRIQSLRRMVEQIDPGILRLFI